MAIGGEIVVPLIVALATLGSQWIGRYYDQRGIAIARAEDRKDATREHRAKQALRRLEERRDLYSSYIRATTKYSNAVSSSQMRPSVETNAARAEAFDHIQDIGSRIDLVASNKLMDAILEFLEAHETNEPDANASKEQRLAYDDRCALASGNLAVAMRAEIAELEQAIDDANDATATAMQPPNRRP